MKQSIAPAMNDNNALIGKSGPRSCWPRGPMGYLPEIFRTIFKTTQNPTMPTIKVATAVNTVVAVVVMVEGSANVGPLLWAKADAAPMEVAATTATALLILFLIVCHFVPFG
jgi:hypothetical protein